MLFGWDLVSSILLHALIVFHGVRRPIVMDNCRLRDVSVVIRRNSITGLSSVLWLSSWNSCVWNHLIICQLICSIMMWNTNRCDVFSIASSSVRRSRLSRFSIFIWHLSIETLINFKVISLWSLLMIVQIWCICLPISFGSFSPILIRINVLLWVKDIVHVLVECALILVNPMDAFADVADTRIFANLIAITWDAYIVSSVSCSLVLEVNWTVHVFALGS